ncbi:MAG: phage tail sheath subtilisin-like domain-containing protein [Candidatus Electrothrix scaldis]|nr:MAG: phage tail sheath subtilisin-like domain-containing protein [Candidatus Electrothrix sp. GW3-3]
MDYNTPGVYIEEKSTGSKPISAVSTTTCAFIGNAPPVKVKTDDNNDKNKDDNKPIPCNNFEEFSRKFLPEDKKQLKDENSIDISFVHAVYGFFSNGGTYCYIVNVAKESIATGIERLKGYEDVALVAAPGRQTPSDYDALITYCENMKNCFAILDGPESFDDPEKMSIVAVESPSISGSEGAAGSGGKSTGGRARPTSFAAQYIPHLFMTSPLTNEKVKCPPSGHIAGIYARTDTVRGVHKAPANIGIRACTGLTQRITAAEQGTLNSNYVNCIRYFPSEGIRVWGARTLSTDNPEWRYINVRRLFLMIEESIKRSTSWTVFEPNDTILQKSITRDITAFLKLQWQAGALVGTSQNEAFFVKCDSGNNPQESVDEGRLIVDIGIAPSKPAEFIIFRVGQWQGGSEVTEM